MILHGRFNKIKNKRDNRMFFYDNTLLDTAQGL